MSNEYLPDDVIFAMISFIPKEIKYINGDLIKIHQTIMKLKQKYSLLEPFIFSKKGIEPISPLLESVFSKLFFTGIICHDNPSYLKFIIKKGAKKCINKNITEKYFSQEQQEQLLAMANDFAKECGI